MVQSDCKQSTLLPGTGRIKADYKIYFLFSDKLLPVFPHYLRRYDIHKSCRNDSWHFNHELEQEDNIDKLVRRSKRLLSLTSFLGVSWCYCRNASWSFIFLPVFIISVFGTLYLASALLSRVKNIKRSHPMLVMISTFFIGYFIIYEVIQ